VRRRVLSALHAGREPDPRFTLANERTLLAWVRTSLGFVAAGLAVYAFGEDSIPHRLVEPVALVLLLAAALLTGAALHRWYVVQVAMRNDRPLPVPYVAVPVAALLLVAVVTSCWIVLS
jgi:putative membrane protein